MGCSPTKSSECEARFSLQIENHGDGGAREAGRTAGNVKELGEGST